jgi:uncharacterized repeat protein (TIGR01451 family)
LARLGETPAAIRGRIPHLPLRDGKVAVEVRFRETGELPFEELEAAGLGEVRAYPRYVGASGRVDLRSLDALAAIPGVVSIRALLPPRRRAGNVASQGDESIRAALARSTFGVDGTGVTVGILSDSFSQILGSGTTSGSVCEPINANAFVLSGSTPQAQGELPATIDVLDDCTNTANCEFASDEGRALAEIVYDLAPGADVLFHSGFNGELDMATGVLELVSCGADVIVDDVIYPREPMFQDGPIAQDMESAVDAGSVVVSTAGNEAGFGVVEDYVDANPGTDENSGGTGDDFHDFGGGDRFGAVRVAPGCGLTFILQWNEPYSGSLGAGASTDLDLFLCTDPLDVNSCSTTSTGQGCSVAGGPEGDPLEEAVFENPPDFGAPQTVHIAVDHVFNCAPPYPQEDDVRFRIVVFGDGCSLGDAEVKVDCSTSTRSYCFEEGIFENFQIYGHAAAESAIAVGASYYREIDTGGAVDPPPGRINVEPFSSLGGDLPFFFTGSGTELPGAPVTRFKPDVVGPDGVNTSFFGVPDPSPGGIFEADGYPNFVGTSAAAPHVAALGALLKDAEPALSGTDVAALLRCTARDIEAPGIDPLAGSGLVDAVDALAALDPQLGLVKSVALTGNVPDTNRLDAGDVLQYRYEVTNSSAVPLASVAVTDPHSGLSAIACPGGNPIPSLGRGESAVCTASYTVKAADESAGSISNSATVTGRACGVPAASGQAGDTLTIPICVLNRVLPTTVVNSPGEEELACRTLDSGSNYTIESGGSATFTAGISIVLQEGFSVAGSFTAELDPEIDLQ